MHRPRPCPGCFATAPWPRLRHQRRTRMAVNRPIPLYPIVQRGGHASAWLTLRIATWASALSIHTDRRGPSNTRSRRRRPGGRHKCVRPPQLLLIQMTCQVSTCLILPTTGQTHHRRIAARTTPSADAQSSLAVRYQRPDGSHATCRSCTASRSSPTASASPPCPPSPLSCSGATPKPNPQHPTTPSNSTP